MSALVSSALAVRFGSCKKVVAVASLKEASRAWEKLRDEQGFGASQSPRVTVVNLTTGKTVAKISYNGCIWDMAGKEIECAS